MKLKCALLLGIILFATVPSVLAIPSERGPPSREKQDCTQPSSLVDRIFCDLAAWVTIHIAHRTASSCGC